MENYFATSKSSLSYSDRLKSVKENFNFNNENIENVFKMNADDFAVAWQDLLMWIDIDDSFTIAAHRKFEELCGYSMSTGGFSNMNSKSGDVGEDWKATLSEHSRGKLAPHPKASGYPDLCDVSTGASKDYFNQMLDGLVPKSEWRIYKFGGREIKACKAKWTKKGKLQMPNVRAHHNEGTNLIMVLWDLDETQQKRKLLAAFYVDKLDPTDWTEFRVPGSKVDGTDKVYSTRSTPGCSLSKKGQQKLMSNCLCYSKDLEFISKLNETIGYDIREISDEIKIYKEVS